MVRRRPASHEDGKTEKNDRLIAVASKSLTHKSLQDISDVSDDLLDQIEHFSCRTTKRSTRCSSRRAEPDATARPHWLPKEWPRSSCEEAAFLQLICRVSGPTSLAGAVYLGLINP